VSRVYGRCRIICFSVTNITQSRLSEPLLSSKMQLIFFYVVIFMNRNIVFLFTGNICRSPMAEGILKKRVADFPIKVSSAGTHVYEGLPASEHGINVARDAGIDISEHRSRSLNSRILENADLVLAMAPEHIDFIQWFFPAFSGKVHLLREFGLKSNELTESAVEDPVGGDEQWYKKCFCVLEEEIDRIMPLLVDMEK